MDGFIGWMKDVRRFSLHSLTVATCCGFSVAALAATVPPPNPKASCASTEYEAEKAQSPAPTLTRNESSTLVVVLGKTPINTTKEIKMGQQVTVCIMGLHDWIYNQKKLPGSLRLVIGGYILSKIAPSSISPSNQEYLNFTLEMDTADSDDWKAWAAVIDASRHSLDHQLPISVGVADTRYVFESNATVIISPYPNKWWWFLVGFVALLAALIYLAASTDLLRYTIGERPSSPLRSPFSLALVQMAVWLYLVLAAYVYICISTDQIHIPMGSALGLLGISATTGLAAVFVDKQKDGTARNQRNASLTEQAALNARIKGLQALDAPSGSASATELSQKQSRLIEVDAALAQLPVPATSKGFIQDVLNDGDGVSFHRFQIALWTVVLGVIFIWAVYRNMSMPEFDPSLLTLMGISSGTYVGFKFPEKPK